MIGALSNSAWSAVELLGDHLWQSTLVAIVIGMLTLVLRQNHPQVRYRLWLAASLKFLVPFGVLTAIGRQFEWRSGASIATSEVLVAIEAISQPFSQPSPGLAVPSPAPLTGPGWPILSIGFLFIWFCGVVVILARWSAQWRRMASLVRYASPVREGPEVEILRRLEKVSGVTRSVRMVASDASVEPGVFGIFRPVLIWPNGMGEHLDDEQTAAIMAHELSHVRRRDNLVAAVHVLTQAVFWFHPLVWWVGARLMDERERSCDQDVLRFGSEPQVYVESILKTCRFSLAGPAACVSGVTGSDLKKRIEAIMRHNANRALQGWKKLLLVTVIITTIGSPIVAGMLNAPQAGAQLPPASGTSPIFELASVRQSTSPEGFIQLGIQPDGRFTASNMPVRMLIRTAYQLQDAQLIGGPDWIGAERFDVMAKAGSNVSLDFPGFGGAGGALPLMLQELLAERFNLKVHRETRELPIYALLLAESDGKLGPGLRPAAVDCRTAMPAARARSLPILPQPGESQICGVRLAHGQLRGGSLLMSQFSMSLSPFVQRVVVDRTGLSGNFDLDLTWRPEQMARGGAVPDTQILPIDPNAPSLFTAVRDQLGLKLDPTIGPVDVLVIDHVEPPIPD
jgi:uncharacterized protein (TIGR03435 family)